MQIDRGGILFAYVVMIILRLARTLSLYSPGRNSGDEEPNFLSDLFGIFSHYDLGKTLGLQPLGQRQHNSLAETHA
jgi:hypothetical protein